MKRVRRQSEMPTRPWLADLKDNLPLEFIGLVLFLIGGGVLLTLLRGGVNSTLGVPYAVIALGWVTPWFALVLLIIGAVFMLGERAGYWGIEAIVGVELLFLSGMMTAFLWHNETVTWEARHDGLNGGLVGWALGSLLMAGLGRWPALAVVWLLAVIGAYLILRYTPLIYLAPFASNLITLPTSLAPVATRALLKRGRSYPPLLSVRHRRKRDQRGRIMWRPIMRIPSRDLQERSGRPSFDRRRLLNHC